MSFVGLLPVNGLSAQFRASAVIATVTLATLLTLPGSAFAAGRDRGPEAAQEPPPVVPDSAPVAPDPAPIAPDPAPAPPDTSSSPDTPSSPDAVSPPVSQVPSQPEQQQFETPTAGAPAPPATQPPSEAEKRPATRRRHARDAPERTTQSAWRASRLGVDAAAAELTAMESDNRRGQLMAAGLALLALVVLSGAFLGFISPLVRSRELQRQ